MPQTAIDHLVVTAPSLESGAAAVENALGVPLQPGGEHPRMGTHNRLLRLGDSAYLEVLAVNPAAPSPARPRWFELDRLDENSPARLAAWVARTDDIQTAAAACTLDLGAIEPMSRGSLRWLLTVPADGALRQGGCAPALIQWQSQPHPLLSMAYQGCALTRLDLYHPAAGELQALLDALGFSGPLRVHPLAPGSRPYLSAIIQTPGGSRRLGG